MFVLLMHKKDIDIFYGNVVEKRQSIKAMNPLII